MLRLKQVVESYGKLPACHRLMLKDYPDHCKDIAEGIENNDRFVRSIVRSAVGMFENSSVSNFVSLCYYGFVCMRYTLLITFGHLPNLSLLYLIRYFFLWQTFSDMSLIELILHLWCINNCTFCVVTVSCVW